MTPDKTIHNIDGSIITPAEARLALKEYQQLRRANQARWLAEKELEEAAQEEPAHTTPPTADDK